ncbi:MAG: response regulator [Candidatus Lokiarchaeota archaeon]|nr:response regulator [Candidatus Lokiarchaeota archaeon]
MELIEIKPLKSILLVEDNPAHVLITKEAFSEVKLENDNYDIEIIDVRDGIEALKLLSKFKSQGSLPDLILIDINIPLLNGLDLLKKIKSHKHYKRIPSIIITNGSRIHEIEDAYKRYANAFIIKPFRYDDFLEMIQVMKLFWFEYATIPINTNGRLNKNEG